MKSRIFSVYDSGASVYQRPFYARENAEAVRAFCDVVRDVESPWGMHPQDYTLMLIGDFNDADGTVGPSSTGPVKIITGLEAVALNRKNDPKASDLFVEEHKDA